MQTVKVTTELVHFLGTRRGVQFSQAPQDSALHFCVEFRSFASRQSSPRALLLKVLIKTRAGLITSLDVSYLLTHVKQRWQASAAVQWTNRAAGGGRNASSKI